MHTETTPPTLTLSASVAADANGNASRDASLTLRYLHPGRDHGTAFRQVDLPWNARQDQIAELLRRDGYTIRTIDLVVADDGYEVHLQLGMIYPFADEQCAVCSGAARCVESRIEDRGPYQQIHHRRYVCVDSECRQVWTRDTNDD